MSTTFASDISFHEQYYGALIRSPIQRGLLLDIKRPTLPDNYFLFTATDIPGDNKLVAMGTTIPIFTPYEIMYLGEPLGIIVGPNISVVNALVRDVVIETESKDVLEFSHNPPPSQISGNLVTARGDIESIFSDANEVFETTGEIAPQDHYYPEPLTAVVDISPEALTIYTASQWPSHVRSTVSSVLDLDSSEIHIVAAEEGESLDGKIWFPSLIAAQAAIAAVLSKHPVSLSFSRQEDFHFSVKSTPAHISYKTVLAEDTSLKAMDIRVLLNTGSYSPLIDEVVERMSVLATGLYAVESYRIEIIAVRTNLPPMGVVTGWGESQIQCMLESHISDIINKKKLSQIDWRLQNIQYAEKNNPTARVTIAQKTIESLFEKTVHTSSFLRKMSAYQLLNEKRDSFKDGPLRGISVVCGYQGNGFVGKTAEKFPYSVQVTMSIAGEVLIETDCASESIHIILITIATEILDIKDTQIKFSLLNNSSRNLHGPETLSTKISILVPLVQKCCTMLQKQRFHKPLPITVKKTYKPSKKDIWDPKTNTGIPFVSITPVVCILELELDPLVYETKIKGIWLSIEAGIMQNRQTAITTIDKTVPAALSRTLYESVTINEGKFIPSSSQLYDILPPSQTPPIHVKFIDSTEESKGIGTIAYNMIPAAYAIALSSILKTPITRIPIIASDIYKALLSSNEKELL